MIHPHAQFKDTKCKTRFVCLHPTCIEVMYEMAEWAEENKLPFLITETVSTLNEDRNLKRMSRTHREARAFDLSIHGWSLPQIKDFMEHFCERFRAVAAVGALTGKPELIVHHDAGHGDHMHVQISRLFAVIEPLKKLAIG